MITATYPPDMEESALFRAMERKELARLEYLSRQAKYDEKPNRMNRAALMLALKDYEDALNAYTDELTGSQEIPFE